MNISRVLKYQFEKLKAKISPSERQKNVAKWILSDGEKLRYEYQLNPSSLVIDIGGYKGQWASDIYSMYNCKIIVIEPQMDFFYKICERFKCNNNIEVFPIALGNSNREELISFDEDASSMFKTSIGKKEIMRVQDVLEFFKNKGISEVDLVKINIEGGEYELLNRLIDTKLINQIKNLQIQFHDFVPNAQMQMQQIQDKLNQTHTITYQFPFVWENWERK